MSTTDLNNYPVLMFDGHCNLCNSSVQFVLKREKNQTLRFTSLQSDAGKVLLAKYDIDPKQTDSIVLIENGKAYVKSSAALRTLKYMKGIYPLGFLLIGIPAFIRNFVYDYIAKNRYKWYGKTDSCMIPDKDLAKRFL